MMNPQLILRKPFIWLILLSLIACGILERGSNLASTSEPTKELAQQIDIQATIDAGVQATATAMQQADMSAASETDSEPSIAEPLPTPTALSTLYDRSLDRNICSFSHHRTGKSLLD